MSEKLPDVFLIFPCYAYMLQYDFGTALLMHVYFVLTGLRLINFHGRNYFCI